MRTALNSHGKEPGSSCRGDGSSMRGIECFLTTQPELDSAEHSEMLTICGASKNKLSNARPPSPASSAPVRSGANISADASVLNTPAFPGLSRPESSLSCVSSPINLSSSSSFIDRDGSFSEVAVHAQGPHFQETSKCEDRDTQLIMPNLHIPGRRPFTDVGQSIGKLRVLVLGPPAIGKSSIIRSIAQICEHIVYTDPPRIARRDGVDETHASTRPCRWWRAESSSLATLKYKRSSASISEDALDRNICFLEYTASGEHAAVEAVEYVKRELAPIVHKQMAEVDLISLLSSGTEAIVDVVLYMLPVTGPSISDIQILSRLQSLTNIIPLLAHADEVDTSSLHNAKEQLIADLRHEDLRIFSFSGSNPSLRQPKVFAVSSATQRDDNTYDASVLMSSTYTEPLVHSDLAELVNCLFSLDGAAQLRHSAALKAVAWLRQNSDRTASSALIRHPYNTNAAAVTLAANLEMRDWKRRGIHGWAQSLRQSLDYERALRFTSRPHSSTEFRLKPSQIMTKRHDASQGTHRRQRTVKSCKQDPLGLIELVGHLKTSGTLAVELLGGIGVVSYLAMCIIRPEDTDRGMGTISHWCVPIT